jgi:hypothetical protein
VSGETTWREVIPEGEAARLEALARRLLGDGTLDGRPLHRKTLAALHARFDVGEAPPDLRHGLFAGGELRRLRPVLISGRGPGRPVPDVRGLG